MRRLTLGQFNLGAQRMQSVSKMMNVGMGTLMVLLSLAARPAYAIDQASTVIALRLASTITGGTMSVTDPLFTQMVSRVQANDIQGAALIAAKSKYFANYLAKRLAFQMQSPALSISGISDSDGTAFLIAHFTGAAGKPPSISTIWSENETYLVNIPINSVMTPTHINQVAGNSGFKIAPGGIDWSTQLTTGGPQQAVDFLASQNPNPKSYLSIPR